MKSKQVLLGLATGAVIGAAFGILFAPDKGRETRKKISKKGSEALDSISEKFEKIKKDMTALAKNGKSKAEDVVA